MQCTHACKHFQSMLFPMSICVDTPLACTSDQHANLVKLNCDGAKSNVNSVKQIFAQQEEWERMGFHGELQGTGQNVQDGLDQDGDAPDEAGHANGPGMKRSR